ncbi:MAG TPA: hypothetical protein VJN96_07570 [Vicinamibacterales bacterium]|nr:hypothetical protein [Vicinamibacterales bacterium]
MAALAAGGVLVAVIAAARVAVMSRRFSALSQSHWELRFEFARLRARVAKLDGGSAGDTAADDPATPARSDS